MIKITIQFKNFLHKLKKKNNSQIIIHKKNYKFKIIYKFKINNKFKQNNYLFQIKYNVI